MNRSPSEGRQLVPEPDEILAQSQQLVARGASEKTDTWHRLHGRMLGLQARRSKSVWVVRWRRVGLVAASLVMGSMILWTATERGWPIAVSTAVEVAFEQGVAKARSRASPETVDVNRIRRPPADSESPPPPDGWTEINLHQVGRLFAAPHAVFHLPNPSIAGSEPSYTVVLDNGEVCAQVSHRNEATQGPFVVQAPGLRAVAVGTRFCVFAGPTPVESWVMVEEGKVRVERDGGQLSLAGTGGVVHGIGRNTLASTEVLASGVDAERAAANKGPTSQQSALSTGFPCPEAPAELRERCLWRQAGGSGFAAQNGLYLLGVMARDQQHDGPAALSIWQTYQHRFPQGVLAVETSWNIFEELVAEHRFDEAMSSSDAFLAQHGDFFRAGELQLRRADILRDSLGRPAEAKAEYQQVLTRESRAALRDEALFGLGRCQERLGERADARSTFELYGKQFPTGNHRAEVARRLEATKDDGR